MHVTCGDCCGEGRHMHVTCGDCCGEWETHARDMWRLAGDDRIVLSPDDRNRCVILVDYKIHLSLASQTKHVPGTRQVQ